MRKKVFSDIGLIYGPFVVLGAAVLPTLRCRIDLLKRPFAKRNAMSVEGREYTLATGRFGAARYHRPLYGDEFEERTDAARPKAVSYSV